MAHWTDRDQSAVYKAEEVWANVCLDELPIDDLAQCKAILAPLVHPTLLDRVDLEVIKGNTGRTLGQLVYTEWYQWRLRVVLPVAPATLIHEAAHLLLESCGGTDLHNADYRRCMVWLCRQHYGARRAGRLVNIYRHHGLEVQT